MTATEVHKEERAVSMPEVMAAVARLHAAADALAAIGARAAAEPGALPSEVDTAIDAVLAAAGVPGLDGLPAPQRAAVAAYVRSAFAQSRDLLDRPGRPPGWSYTDVAVLEGQGRGSMAIPTLLAQTGELGEVASFLDVGTGVGWLAVGAAQEWPGSTVVGIDTWEPALERARANVADSGLGERIELRHQDVGELPDDDRFDLTWLPAFFISVDALPAALARILTATRTGGQVVVARYAPPADELAHRTLRLRTLRDGGSWLEPDEFLDLLRDAGWTDVRALPAVAPGAPMFLAGRKP